MNTLSPRASSSQQARFGWFLWSLFLLAMLGLTVLYATLPADGYTGDLESFAVSDGFLVRFTTEPRPDTLQPGDIIRRVDGVSIDDWLTGQASVEAHWYQGGTARYDIEREGQALTLEIPLRPNGLLSWLSWPTRLVVMLAFFSIGTFVFYKRPEDENARRMMLFCMAVTLSFYSDIYNFQVNAVILRYPLWIQLITEHIAYGMQFITAAHFAMSFPSPYSLWARFPRLAPLVLWVLYLAPVIVATLTAPTLRAGLVEGNRAAIFGSLICMVLVIYANSRNLSRIKDPIQRSQSKWILWSAFLAGALIFPIYFLPLITNTGRLIPPDFTFFLLSLIPVSFAIAILRFRLFAIDLVINRSLVYGTTFLLLSIILIGGFQALSPLLGDNSIVILAILLVIGALMTRPLVRGIQGLVDRYLYRLRFDLNDLARAHVQPEIKRPGFYTGRVIGGYQVGDVLGRGSMSEVYAGYNEGRIVSVKILLSEVKNDSLVYGQFKHEAQAMTGLKHPNIRALYQQGEADGIDYLILEYIEGYDLKTYLRQHGHLSLEETRRIMGQLGAALDYLHAQGIVHRDLKPENIMLHPVPGTQDFHVSLTDFGLAKLSEQSLSIYGEEAVGTINYMSPEQIQAEKTIDYRADIYAMGVMLYELLTGELPFKGGLAQILFAHLSQPAPDICDVVPDLPGDVALAIMQAMSKEANDRPSSVQDLLAMI